MSYLKASRIANIDRFESGSFWELAELGISEHKMREERCDVYVVTLRRLLERVLSTRKVHLYTSRVLSRVGYKYDVSDQSVGR